MLNEFYDRKIFGKYFILYIAHTLICTNEMLLHRALMYLEQDFKMVRLSL